MPLTPEVNVNEKVLVRIINAGLQTRVPMVNNQYFRLLAEDGNPRMYTPEQYTVLLPAGKTKDIMLVPESAGRMAIYDRTLHLTNGPVSPGGMLTFIQVAEAAK